MFITKISLQAKNSGRVNIFIDGKYSFSLSLSQLADLKLKQNQELSGEQLAAFKDESLFGKLYFRTVDYCLLRPRSVKEVKDYLFKKTLSTKYKSKKTGEIKQREGVSALITNRVLEAVIQKKYVDDENFARWWVENRNLKKGVSQKKLRSELLSKGVDSKIIEAAIAKVNRDDKTELQKVITKKYHKYDDQQKLIRYLAGQGFNYYDIVDAINEFENE